MEAKETVVGPPPGLSEDWTATAVGLLVLVVALGLAQFSRNPAIQWDSSAPPPLTAEDKAAGKKQESPWAAPLKGWIGKFSKWEQDPTAAFRPPPKAPKPDAQKPDAQKPDAAGGSSAAPVENPGPFQWWGIVGALLATALIGVVACVVQRLSVLRFLRAFGVVFALAVFSFVLAAQATLENYNLEFALWALLVGLLVSNTVGVADWLKPAVRSELYIKIGLVLLGAEVLFTRLLALGVRGVVVSWIVTPVVLVSTYIFGQRVLRMQSKSLNLVISADMSVCGVSAAIATAAACKAKKEELSLAVGLSLTFTVVMMVIMPRAIEWMQLDPVVGGAWLGGTIDSTGAVAAAANSPYLGALGMQTAITVKMIQNLLIGATAMGVAVYWTRWVEPQQAETVTRIGPGEIWKRFPKFVLGFLAASVVCSLLFAGSYYGELWVGAAADGFTKQLRTWLFCLAFVSIGLETNFRQLMPYLRSGKPLVLYLCGQSLNLLLTLVMAWIMFGWLFPTGSK
jgi:uncharacterized membrane protein YadS